MGLRPDARWTRIRPTWPEVQLSTDRPHPHRIVRLLIHVRVLCQFKLNGMNVLVGVAVMTRDMPAFEPAIENHRIVSLFAAW